MPLGAFRLNSLARYVPAAVGGGTWADWTDTDVGTLRVDAGSDERDYRSADVINCGYDDKFYTIGYDVTNRADGYLQQYNLSGSTLTYDSQIATFTNTVSVVINKAIGFDFSSFSKSVYIHSVGTGLIRYRVFKPNGSGGVTVSSEKDFSHTGALLDIWTSVLIDPNDQTALCITDRDGVILHCTWDNSAETITADSRTDVANVQAASAQYCLIDNAGTTQIACFFYDTGTSEWKVTRMDMDGGNSSTTTLVSGASLGTTAISARNSKHYKTVTDFIYLFRLGTEDDVGMWVANWSGSSWTAPSSYTTISTTSTDTTNFNTPLSSTDRTFGTALEENVWAFMHGTSNNTNANVILFTIGLYSVSGQTITQLGLVTLNDPDYTDPIIGYSNQDDFGFSLPSDGSYLICQSDDADDAGGEQSLSVLIRPT